MHCCIPTHTTDSNTSTGITCRVPRRIVANRQSNVREFHIVWRVVTPYVTSCHWGDVVTYIFITLSVY